MGYLFGNILSVRPGDVLPLASVSLLGLGVIAFYFKELLFVGVDEEAARAAGLPVVGLRLLMLTVLAVTIVAAVRLVGIVLVSAFLVIPAATGQAMARSLTGMIGIAVGSAIFAVVSGLWVSWMWDLPSGAAIVLVAAGLFFLALVVARRR
jgi:ABC-type Mn2+/Zn2+ transport system permease subunit